jgi:hypothetical protein
MDRTGALVPAATYECQAAAVCDVERRKASLCRRWQTNVHTMSLQIQWRTEIRRFAMGQQCKRSRKGQSVCDVRGATRKQTLTSYAASSIMPRAQVLETQIRAVFDVLGHWCSA